VRVPFDLKVATVEVDAHRCNVLQTVLKLDTLRVGIFAGFNRDVLSRDDRRLGVRDTHSGFQGIFLVEVDLAAGRLAVRVSVQTRDVKVAVVGMSCNADNLACRVALADSHLDWSLEWLVD